MKTKIKTYEPAFIIDAVVKFKDERFNALNSESINSFIDKKTNAKTGQILDLSEEEVAAANFMLVKVKPYLTYEEGFKMAHEGCNILFARESDTKTIGGAIATQAFIDGYQAGFTEKCSDKILTKLEQKILNQFN